MTAGIPNSTPPVETKAADGLGPKRPVVSGSLETPADGAQVSEISRSVSAALGTDDQKVEALRREVSAGAYVIDPVKIAEKMLEIEKPK